MYTYAMPVIQVGEKVRVYLNNREVRGGREREKIIGERVERGCVYTKLCSNQSYE